MNWTWVAVKLSVRMRVLLSALILLMGIGHAPMGVADDVVAASAENPFAGLLDDDFDRKAEAIQWVEKSGHPRALPILQAMIDDKLFSRKEDGRLVLGVEIEDGYAISDALTGEALGDAGKRDVRRVSLNNALRGSLLTTIAKLSLASADTAVRLSAATSTIKDINAETGELFRQRLVVETDAKVREILTTGIALVNLDSTEESVRIRAIATLEGNLNQDVRNRLATMVERHGDGSFGEANDNVRAAASHALASIEQRLAWYGFLENVFFGISLGSVLLLAAVGLAITFGVMGVINMAHGELIMLGAYTTYVVQQFMPNHIGASLAVAVPLAFLVAALVGIAIERGIIRFLYGRPLETLLATFGVSLILQQAVRSIFSPLNRSVQTPDWMSGSLALNEVLSITYSRLYIIVFAFVVFALLVLVMKKTTLGLQVRAVAQNRGMARAMGVRSGWVDAMTFGLGSGIAGIAGVALSQLTNVGPNMGQAYIIDSFMVVVFGGVGNLWGTFVGALSLGVINKFMEPWAGAVLAKILVLVAIILFIQKRPRGLFPQKGRAVEG